MLLVQSNDNKVEAYLSEPVNNSSIFNDIPFVDGSVYKLMHLLYLILARSIRQLSPLDLLLASSEYVFRLAENRATSII